MSYQTTTIRNSPVLVDSGAPTVPLTSMTLPGGSLLAATAARTQEIADRVMDVRDFGNGVMTGNDDTTALSDALTYIKASGYGGTIQIPAGTLKLASPLTVDTSNTRIIGSGDNTTRTVISYTGSGKPFTITAYERTRFENLRFTGVSAVANGITHCLSYEYNGAVTGLMHSLKNVHIVGFNAATTSCGVRLTNNEMFLAEHVQCYDCGIGLYADNSNHTGGALGMNNLLHGFRAQSCTGNGIDIASQSAFGIFHSQSLRNGATDAMVFVRGSCTGALIHGLDAESDGQTKIGLLLAGVQHSIHSGNWVSLAQAIKLSSATGCFIGAQRMSGNAAGLLFDSGSTTNRWADTGYQVTDQGNGNRPMSGGIYRAVTGATTALSSDRTIECTSGTFTVTLPSAARLIGPVTIYNSGAGTITVGGTVSGSTNPTLATGKYMTVVATGSTYLNIGSN